MIEKVIAKYYGLLADPGFLRFQHQVITRVYAHLGQGFKKGEGEVPLVARFAKAVEGKNYGGLTLHCKKIHGPKSYVSFHFRDKPTTKELGDLVLLTVVSSGRQRLLQKLCIVQNKMLREGKAPIDAGQLFFLKNFPPFSGIRGLFRGAKDVVFQNRQGCLGAYGFFEPPGEMLHVNASRLSDSLAGSATFSKRAFGAIPQGDSDRPDREYLESLQLPWLLGSRVLEETCRWRLFGGAPLSLLAPCAPFTSSRQTHHDLHDFFRAWVTLRVGELVYLAGRPSIDVEAEAFSTNLLRLSGLGEYLDLGEGNLEHDPPPGLQIMVAHLDVGEG